MQTPDIQDHPSTDELPILNGKQTPDTTEDGLPILKKKDEKSASPQNSPSDSLPTPTVTSASALKSDLAANLFGIKGKDDVSDADPNLFADEKGSLIKRATTKALKREKDPIKIQAINMRKHELTTKFFSGTLDGNDVEYISNMINPASNYDQGLSNDQIATAINNKTKNMRVWSNVAMMNGVDNYNKELSSVNQQLADLDEGNEFNVMGGKHTDLSPEQRAQVRKELQTKKDFLQHSFNSVYEAEKESVLPKIAADLKNNIHNGKDWDQIMDQSYRSKTKDEEEGLDRPAGTTPSGYFVEYNPASHTLTKESTASVLKFADDWQAKNKNKVIAAGPQNDIGNSLVEYLNTVPLQQKVKRQYDENWKKLNKDYAPLVDAQQKIQSYFTKDNIKAAEASVKADQDKAFVLNNEKYYGKNGIITTNPELIKLHNKYAESVARGDMTAEVAKKNIQVEIENDPILSKLNKQYDDDVKSIQEKGQKLYENFITNGIEATIDPNLVFYKSGNIGVKGKSEAQSRVVMEQYNEGLTENIAKTFHQQNEALNLDANQRADRFGFFGGTLKQAANDQLGALYNWYFHKTGWDGDNARAFQAEKIAEIPISNSQTAQAWNWQGMKSLIDPKFWGSKIAGMIPVIVPSAAMTAVTEGAGLPEAVGWLSSAGVFTAQDMMSFHESLKNTTDKFGRRLTEEEIDKATADQGRDEFFPNLAFMALNLGTLTRAKGLTKPTIGAAVKGAVAGAALGTPAMAVQGYLSYANSLKAQGKTPDMFDYMQDDHFATSLIDGFIGGLGMQLAHTPSNYIKSLKNYKTMMTENAHGEFRNGIIFSSALHNEIDGKGNYYRDAAKLHLFNGFGTQVEKAEVKQLLQYSTALDKNIKTGGIDISTVEGAYQAHSLAMADLHDQWAEESKDNKNISKIYADQAKEFRDQAKNSMTGKGKFHYLIDSNGNPIFLSEQSFKNLDAEGNIKSWIDRGVIKSVHNSGEPDFNSEYQKSHTQEEEHPRRAPLESKLEEGQSEEIINALRDHRDKFSKAGESMFGIHLDNPESHEQLANTVISQAADHQGAVEEMIGPEAFKKIKPIIDEQMELAKPKVEDLPELRDKKESREILGKDIPDELGRKNITFNGESKSADEHIKDLSDKHKLFDEIIKNCL